MERKTYYFRLAAVMILFLAATALLTLKLLDIQVVNGREIRQEAERTVVRKEAVDASRGEIYDRNGVKLVSNKTAFNIRFDYFLWQEEEGSRVIDDTLSILAKYGISYSDTLPITKYPYRYTYAGESGTAAQTRMEAFLEENDWPKTLSAADAMEKLCEKYGITDAVSSNAARAVAGVRYDMERRGFSSVNPFTLASDVPLEAVMVLEERSSLLPGVSVEVGSVRTIETEYAAHILGHTGLIFKEDYEEYKELGYPMDAIVGRDGM